MQSQTLSQWLVQARVSAVELARQARLEPKVLEAMLANRYTPSPAQRQRVAAALGVNPERINWDHAAGVEHMHGHGPQFGRSP